VKRIQHLIGSRTAVAGLLALVAALVAAACNNGSGGGPAY
jgi:hypothetical protein